MKAVILDGFKDQKNQNINQEVIRMLEEKEWTVDNYQLRDEKIASCTGCFGCWLKTPGTCVINDKGREISGKVIQSDLTVLLTPITFGGYSYELKKVMDRLIPNILPFFAMVDGEVHHQARYDKYPNMLGIGCLPGPDPTSEETFTKLVERNSINFYSHHQQALILTGDYESGNLEKIMKFVEEVEGIV